MNSVEIHPTSVVSGKAELGSGVIVGPYSVIDAGAKIGDGTRIESFVRITEYVIIGRNCHIFENSVLGHVPQDHGFSGERSYVRIGDDVIIRESVTINRASGEGRETSVGDGTMLMEGCHLGHNVRIGRECTVTNKVGFSGHCDIGNYVVIGGIAGLHQFVKVGDYAMVGGLARIIKDVPPYTTAAGSPARIYGLNNVGLRRRGFTQEQRTRIKNIYKLLFSKNMLKKEAIALIEQNYPGDELALSIINFARSAKRGLTSWAFGSQASGASEEGPE